ncbi:globin domain-containing protein [Leisingera caerulea]|uniref:Globin n=1 Tax=Leisingera caerulea TaxID=506591 RepID=A0A9Q9M2R6_LEICA|nr:globin domain-containing protein [Leisingera caerulea]UWQ53813.1 globin [Leisingera caerulea]
MVSAQDKSLVRKTFESERMDLDAFATAFYAKFFAACPDVRPLFSRDMTRQEEKLLAILTHVAEALDDSARLDAILRQQGEKHRKRDVSDAHFRGFITSFTGALSDTLGPDWSAEAELAWTRFLTFVAGKMNFAVQR